MATKSREVSGKEKKSSPSSHLQRQGYPRLIVSKSEPGASQAEAPLGKPIPNYLKPTFSSKPEITTKYVRKSSVIHGNDTGAGQKALMQRRRSFDKASSGSSPSSKDATVATARTSSLKSANKSVSRTSVKPPSLRRSTSDINSAPVSSATSPTKCDEHLIAEEQAPQTHHDVPIHDDGVDRNDPINVEACTEESMMSNNEGETAEHCNDVDAVDGKPVMQVADVDDIEEEGEDHHEGEMKTTTEMENPCTENASSEDEKAVQDLGEQNRGDEGTVDDANGVEEAELSEKSREEGTVTEPERTGEQSAFVQFQKKQVNPTKKETPSAYNDVIEETKNKLLETRKNKVKALVGAFETVIDYESASK